MSNYTTYTQQVIRGTYYPHVDGIRALAVLAVLLYHLSANLCPGGYMGVDVFFVISGYLIGGGIIRDLRSGSFSFSGFYTRRIKRIMPAYFGMILISLLVGVCVYHYEPLTSLGNAALRSSYFYANFFCYKFLGNYFVGDAAMHPLINLWSLSVEEQFYIVIPLLCWLCWKVRRQALPILLLAVFAYSLYYSESLLGKCEARATVKAFYLLVPRAWELLAGVLLAYVPRVDVKRRWKKAATSVLAVAGVGVIVGAYYLMDGSCHFPGQGAIPAVFGTALAIRYGEAYMVGNVLSSGLFVGIGRISYSLYLWHWPIIAYMHYFFSKTLTPAQMLFAAALSFVCAFLSWRYLEMPIRRNKNITFARAFGGLVVVCAVTAAIGGWFYSSKGLVKQIHQDANRYASLEYPRHLRPFPDGRFGIPQLNGLQDEKGKQVDEVVKVLGNADTAPEFVLIGDSHAEALQIGLDDVCAQRGISGLAIAFKTCPLWGVELRNTFPSIAEPFVEWLKKAPSVKTVLLECRWDTRINADTVQILARRGEPPVPKEQNGALTEEGLRKTLEEIRAAGKDVVLFGPVPPLRFSPGTELRRRVMLGLPADNIGESISEEEFNAHEEPTMKLLRTMENEGLARIVWVHPVLEQNGRFSGMRQGKLFYHDDSHLSGDGSRYVIDQIFNQLFGKD